MGIVVAVSGGGDSVALLRMIVDVWTAASLAVDRLITVAHFNHGVRGERSDHDQRFVAELAARLGTRFVTETAAAERDAASPATDEASLRKRRYDFLTRVVAGEGARCVLTAHTADDQIETLLHHLFRGTGPAGACGIPASRPLATDFLVVRPLLAFRGSELRDGLDELGQTWCRDQTNDDPDYRRNWIRGELLPQIRQRYPAADEALLRFIESQCQWRATLDRMAENWVAERVSFADQSVSIGRGTTDAAMFGLAVAKIWDRQRWPRQSLAASHYRQLRHLIDPATAALSTGQRSNTDRHVDTDLSVDTDLGADTDPGTAQSLTLPGGLRAAVIGNRLRIAAVPDPRQPPRPDPSDCRAER